MFKTKILVLGPCQAGKTSICNLLSEATETSGGAYHPTQGARILEFEVSGVNVNGRNVTTEVELWDCSGDHKFEACWPSVARDSNGAVFVVNPDQPNHDKELEAWYTYFGEQQGLRETQCIVFAHNKAGGRMSAATLPRSMERVQTVSTNIDDESDALRDTFRDFLGKMMTTMSDKHEQEELSIMNS